MKKGLHKKTEQLKKHFVITLHGHLPQYFWIQLDGIFAWKSQEKKSKVLI